MLSYQSFSVLYRFSFKDIKVFKSISLAICFLMFSPIFLNVEALATIYYVSPSGLDTNPGTEESRPFKTIQKGADVVNPGDTVIVKDGIYTDTDGDNIVVWMKRGGSPGNYVTFQSENKWGAILEGAVHRGILIGITGGGDMGYIRIKDFEIRESGAHGIKVAVPGNPPPSPHHIEIIGNHIHNTNYSPINLAITSSDNLVEGNLLHDSPSHLLYLMSPNTTVQNNIFYNSFMAIPGFPQPDTIAGWCIQTKWSSHNIKIVNNTFVGPISSGAPFGTIVINQDCDNVLIENNIFYNGNGGYGIYVFAHDAGSVTVRNNLSSNKLITYSNHITQTQIENLFTFSNNITNSDPLFKNAASNDYSLKNSTSPAIDRGFASGAPSFDYDGNPRPNGFGYDIGAYEASFSEASFSLSSSGNISVTQGASVSDTVTASLDSGTAQSVSYSASGLPSGATATFSPDSCSPDCSTTLTINTSGSTPTGTYTIKVTGKGGGITKTISLGLRVENNQLLSRPTGLKARIVSEN